MQPAGHRQYYRNYPDHQSMDNAQKSPVLNAPSHHKPKNHHVGDNDPTHPQQPLHIYEKRHLATISDAT